MVYKNHQNSQFCQIWGFRPRPRWMNHEESDLFSNVGSMYCSISCEKSTDTLIKEAEQGDTKAQYTLGQIYFDSDSVQHDYAETLKWYRKAAEQDVGADYRRHVSPWGAARSSTPALTRTERWSYKILGHRIWDEPLIPPTCLKY